MHDLYIASKFVIFNSARLEVLLMEKTLSDGKKYYEPGGGRVEIDFNARKAENLEACCIREAKEETGLHCTIKRYLGSYYFFWDNASACSLCGLFEITPDTNPENIESIHSVDDGGEIIFKWVKLKELNVTKKLSPNLIGIGSLLAGA